MDLLLPRSNYTFVPAPEPRISIYVGRNVALAPFTGAGVHFIAIDFEPGEPQRENACGFLFWLPPRLIIRRPPSPLIVRMRSFEDRLRRGTASGTIHNLVQRRYRVG